MGWASFLAFGAIIVLLAKPVGWWLLAVYDRRPLRVADRVLGPLERAIYRVCGVDPTVESRWGGYAIALIAFNVVGIVALFIQLRIQHLLPTGAGFEGMSPTIALNTAVSFVTNTNWQAYAGETGTSPLSQMAGLTLQQFLSASTGMAVAAALIRGFARDSARKVGNFWVDLTRSWLYILLPVSIVLAIGYVALGVPQTLGGTVTAQTLEGATQTIPIGPLASMEAIKELGTNGGGYFNANSAHPFEGPTPLAAYIQMIVIFSIPAGFTWMFGKACGDTRQGWAVFATMLLLFSIGAGLVYAAEQQAPPLLADTGADVAASDVQSGGNMEGKETRFGVAESSLYAAVTTSASNGAVIAMHDSLTPLAGGMVLLNMMLGEVVFGGVGVGLAGMLIFAILAVFIAGLMVGRTPEYVGKKIESYEVRMAMLAVLAVAGPILALTAVASVVPSALDGRLNAGPHGFTEILYAFASGAGNNGSALGGLAAASPFYAIGVSVAMFIGRYLFIVPVLAIAGSLVAKKRVPPSAGTLPTTGGLFVGLLAGVVLIVGALTFFPALALGPLVEHFSMLAGKLF